jgi:hypothetical protein
VCLAHAVSRPSISTRPLCVEGPGGCPTPPQADPLLATHLLGVPVFTGKSHSRSAPLLLRYASPLIGCAIILPLSNLRWVVSKWSLRRVRAAVSPLMSPFARAKPAKSDLYEHKWSGWVTRSTYRPIFVSAAQVRRRKIGGFA